MASVDDDAKISDLVARTHTGWFSLEFFPPRTSEGVANLKSRVARMKELQPLFTDFTWGAGGSTSQLTLELAAFAKNGIGTVANMHLTCTSQRTDMVDEALAECRRMGVRNIVALRGDPPRGQERWEATEGGFACALDLVKHIRERHGDYFSISVAGYPEGHPDCIEEVEGGLQALSAKERRRASISCKDGRTSVTVCRDARYEEEIKYLREKVEAGAGFIITQMFLDPQVYLDFVQECRAHGITVPIVPGIMCLNTLCGLQRMSSLCKTRLPDGFLQRAEAANTSDDAFKAWGILEGVKLCRSCLDGGAPGLHFYTLNLETVVVGVLVGVGMITAEQAHRCTTTGDDVGSEVMVSAQGISTGMDCPAKAAPVAAARPHPFQNRPLKAVDAEMFKLAQDEKALQSEVEAWVVTCGYPEL